MEYQRKIEQELKAWQLEMMKAPSLVNRLTKRLQDKVNDIIPERVHQAITKVIKQMFRAVLFGSEFTTAAARTEGTIELREVVVSEKINFYKKIAATEGGITGAGGILAGLADFPLLLAIKMKFLFEVAAVYGFDVRDYKERVYILYIFQVAFSSRQKRKEAYLKLEDWNNYSAQLPSDIHQFDWRSFQQEYRDYIDLAKMAQLIPVIGAPVGAIVNYKLLDKLGKTAMNAYRMRLQQKLLAV